MHSMHVVRTQDTKQNTTKEGVDGLAKLLEFLESEWNRHENSKRLSMRDLKVPLHITHIVIEEVTYELRGPRIIWFEKVGRRYNHDRFYISEGSDMDGQSFQLYLDRSPVNNHDSVRLIRARRVGGPKIYRTFSATGPRIQD